MRISHGWAAALVGGSLMVGLGGAARASTSFTTIDVPDATGTYAEGINDAGQIVGGFEDSTGTSHGFLYSGGTFTTIDVPGATFTQVHGINDASQVVGDFEGKRGLFHGFLDSGGAFTIIDVPGATGTYAEGINGAGQIVGAFTDGTGTHGFLDSGGVFTTIDVPSAADTSADGINGAGQIVGLFDDSTQAHGFLDSGGTFTTIDFPGATDTTQVFGINGAGQIVGLFDEIGGGRPGLPRDPDSERRAGAVLAGAAWGGPLCLWHPAPPQRGRRHAAWRPRYGPRINASPLPIAHPHGACDDICNRHSAASRRSMPSSRTSKPHMTHGLQFTTAE